MDIRKEKRKKGKKEKRKKGKKEKMKKRNRKNIKQKKKKAPLVIAHISLTNKPTLEWFRRWMGFRVFSFDSTNNRHFAGPGYCRLVWE